MSQLAAPISQRVEEFIDKICSGWNVTELCGGSTFTYFAYRWEEKLLREAYEKIRNDRDFSGLFFKWNGLDDTKSVSFSISRQEFLVAEALPSVKESSRQELKPLFAKKRRRRKPA